MPALRMRMAFVDLYEKKSEFPDTYYLKSYVYANIIIRDLYNYREDYIEG